MRATFGKHKQRMLALLNKLDNDVYFGHYKDLLEQERQNAISSRTQHTQEEGHQENSEEDEEEGCATAAELKRQQQEEKLRRQLARKKAFSGGRKVITSHKI